VAEPTAEEAEARVRAMLGAHLSRMQPAPPPQALATRFVDDVLRRADAARVAGSEEATLALFSRWADLMASRRAPAADAAAPAARSAAPSVPPRPGSASSDAKDSDAAAAMPSGVRPGKQAAGPSAGGVYDRDGFLVGGPAAGSAAPAPSSSAADASAGDALQRIRVVVRKRPLNRREARRGELDVVEAVSRRTMLMHETRQKVDLTRYTETHEFRFDDVFDHTCDTALVYRHTTRPLVDSVFEGRRATVFAYGQTGSGKTHTMMGGPTSPGLYVLAAEDIFSRLREDRHSRLRAVVSFFEIYGGKLFDLLNGRRQLRALADAKEAVVVKGLSEQAVSSVEAMLRVIEHGNAARSTGSTGANADSSRSHAILSISLCDRRSGKPAGKFSFIDLAGSERGADTKHTDRRTRLEGAEINKSLLALKECIRSLYQEHDHLPFRGSKLTQVLRDGFVGDSLTVMIATVSPNASNCDHSLNTLRYAYRVKEIRREAADASEGDPPHGTAAENPYAFRAVMSRRRAGTGPRADFDDGGPGEERGGLVAGVGEEGEEEEGVLAGREGQRPAVPLGPIAAPSGDAGAKAARRGGGRAGGAAPAAPGPAVAASEGDEAVRRRVMSRIPRSSARGGARAGKGRVARRRSSLGSGGDGAAAAAAAVECKAEEEGGRAASAGRRRSAGGVRRAAAAASALRADRQGDAAPEAGEEEDDGEDDMPAETAPAADKAGAELEAHEGGLARGTSDGWLPAAADPSSAGLDEDVSGVVRRHREQVASMMAVLQEEMALASDVRAIARMGAKAYVDRVEVLLGEKLFLIDAMGGAVSELKASRGWDDDEGDEEDAEESGGGGEEEEEEEDAEEDVAAGAAVSPAPPRGRVPVPGSAGSSVASPAALLIT